MMSSAVIRTAFRLALIPIAGCSSGLAQAEHPKDKFNPKAEVDEFVSAVDFPEMLVYTQHWSTELPPEQRKQILVELLHRLRNTREGFVENYDDMFVLSRVQAGKMKWHGHGLKFEQDIFFVNGRSAWAIEEILGCYLPNFTAEVAHDPRKLDENVRQSFFKVVEAMELPGKRKPESKPVESKGKSVFVTTPAEYDPEKMKDVLKTNPARLRSRPRAKTESEKTVPEANPVRDRVFRKDDP